MTTAARLVLQDCRHALREFDGRASDARWRVIYMANVALLRAVYHVLEARDVPNDEKLKREFSKWKGELLRTKPSPEIYWLFIVDERNQLLKEYAATPVKNSLVPEIRFDLSTGKTEDLGLIRQQYLMAEGHFVGQEQRRLIKRAIEWWEHELSQLERSSAA
jgi:hypothetical protein